MMLHIISMSLKPDPSQTHTLIWSRNQILQGWKEKTG